MRTLTKLTYPPTRRSDQVDDYHGTKVADPYRWLEDPASAETKAWVEAQGAVTRPFLDALPHREKIKARMTELWDYPKTHAPFKVARRYFWYANTGLQNQDVLFTGPHPYSQKARVLIDPNLLSKDGTVALSGISISPNARLIAYGVSASGSDWQEWRLRDIATRADLPDVVRWCKFTNASWSRDGKGFYYSRYDEPKGDGKHEDANENQKVYYHSLGTDQSLDQLIYARPDHPKWSFSCGPTEDGRYLVLYASEGFDSNQLYVKDLREPEGQWMELFNQQDAHYTFVHNEGSRLYFQTDKDSPRNRIVLVDVNFFTGGSPALEEVVPECEQTLENVSVLDGKIVAFYLKDAHSVIRIFDLHGRVVRDVKLPGLGSVSGFGGEGKQYVTYFTYTSFNTPGTIYRYNMRTGESKLLVKPQVKFDADQYVTEQVFYTSKDGTRVPMFISYRKGLVKNGQNPTYLYGYGGFNINETPSFSMNIMAWMEMGGIFAEPNLRGGGEYGEAWHQAGAKLNKQNVFDDFIAAARWLIANNYTSSSKLAIGGGSNGGLLVGACLTQQPSLYAAAFPAVGVLDMLRFHKFTIGSHWVSEYGCSDNPADFKALYAYSPLHNVHVGTVYPPTLVTTADTDDRVVPAHSYKFISTLQYAQCGESPVLIRIETKAGHGAGKPTAKIIEEASDKWAFALWAMDAAPQFAAK